MRDARVEARARRIVGLAGLLGSGRTEVARAIFGADPPEAEPIRLTGRDVSPVVGGTRLTGGVCSVATTRAGVLLLGLIFNVLNFENGLGWISLSACWQSVARGVFLMVVVMAGSGAARRSTRNS